MDPERKAVATKQERFEALLQRHVGIVLRVVQTYCRQPEDQQDLVQEIKLQVWQAFAKYDERRVFSTWMYRIALNTAISWTRRSSLRLGKTESLDAMQPEASVRGFDHDLQALYQLIDQLDLMDRAVLMLYLDDLSHAEIGEVLGITATNAATKISRLKQKLRQEALDSGTATC